MLYSTHQILVISNHETFKSALEILIALFREV